MHATLAYFHGILFPRLTLMALNSLSRVNLSTYSAWNLLFFYHMICSAKLYTYFGSEQTFKYNSRTTLKLKSSRKKTLFIIFNLFQTL